MTQHPASLPANAQRIAVIGAGPVGLSVARALKLAGIAYEQFEADDKIGGIWYHGAYATAHIISSKKVTQYPEYPMPADYPDFPSQAQVLTYLNDYADHFGLHEHIRLNRKVIDVSVSENELWQLTFADYQKKRYKGVIVCNGHHWDPRWPDYPGQFSGEFIHSKQYQNPEQLRGKHVLVIGGGNSACDIVSEAARVGASAHLSLRHGYWFMPKTAFGKPMVELVGPYPVCLQRWVHRLVLAVCVGDYRRYGLPKPDHRIFDRHPTISTEALHYLKHGRITPHGDIERFDGDHVVFKDGSKQRVDMVVCATGYHVSYPFLAQGLVDINKSVVKNYWGLVSPHYRHLYTIAWGQPRSGFGQLLSPLTATLVSIIKTQDKLRRPMGKLLAKLRTPLPETHLADPYQLELAYFIIKLLLPTLPMLERVLCRDLVQSDAVEPGATHNKPTMHVF